MHIHQLVEVNKANHSFGYYAGPATKHPLITRNLYWPLKEPPKLSPLAVNGSGLPKLSQSNGGSAGGGSSSAAAAQRRSVQFKLSETPRSMGSSIDRRDLANGAKYKSAYLTTRLADVPTDRTLNRAR